MMQPQTQRGMSGDSIKQFSIYAENKVGRLNELVGLLNLHHVHIMALCTLDTTDSAIIRLIVDYPHQARELLYKNDFTFSEAEIIAVEFETEAHIKKITCALIQAEINIHYVYSFVMRPHQNCGLVLHLEDNDLARDVLEQHGVKVLTQGDISR